MCDIVCSSWFFFWVKWFPHIYIYIHICCGAIGFNLIKLAKPPSKYISLFSGEANIHLYGPFLSNTFTCFFCWCSLAPQDMKQNGLQPWLAWKLELLFVCFVGWWVWCQCLLLVMIGFFQKPMRCLWRCLKQVVFLNLLTEQGLRVVVNMEHFLPEQ